MIEGTQGYGNDAPALAEQYESITFGDVHHEVMHLFPSPPARILDVGAGSGRDAAALTVIGHRVVAVEPTDALRREGMRLHGDKPIEWIDDHLPDLAQLHHRKERFDLILLTAVWMHLDSEERRTAMRSLAGLLNPHGRISMSLRHGPVPQGRRMFEVSAAETIELAGLHGLSEVHVAKRNDMLGRSDIHWTFVVLERGR
ncbi:class I SAM-dependent methyltransferase [Azospirillum picis]|uniref:Protein-L-isoaspartate O-methyltransferase n=1 Tax=Azospirillum picis TaxID=488438 RepID=A0ABU0MM50_9PROT|nr:class I SAM-dependent methyltransferase [Azospirillum picis]MBP2300579.1 protein-L-isoaspartate O-methyltransferase [Azospirillum picis]MDQ0534548.1 protein-L-isoaspartate O-methyltransferase [Azospirillum picis]